jgi:hypothetical protein
MHRVYRPSPIDAQLLLLLLLMIPPSLLCVHHHHPAICFSIIRQISSSASVLEYVTLCLLPSISPQRHNFYRPKYLLVLPIHLGTWPLI